MESRIQSLMRVLSTGSTADPEVEAQAAAAAAADAKLSEEEAAKAAEDADKYKEEEVTKVVVGLQVAKKMAKEKEEMAKEKEEAAAKEKAKATSLPVLAEAALKAKKPFFTSNPDGMPVDTRCSPHAPLPPPTFLPHKHCSMLPSRLVSLHSPPPPQQGRPLLQPRCGPHPGGQQAVSQGGHERLGDHHGPGHEVRPPSRLRPVKTRPPQRH